uniref:Uncharacterized protein n=1 Tax=Cyprinus carpio TaxID=7962 RepID=A0A8C1R186_CYPCA
NADFVQSLIVSILNCFLYNDIVRFFSDIQTKLHNCGLTDEGCAALASALRSNPSHLRELSLTDNKLKDSGVTFLSDVLKDPHCKLEILQ